MDADNLRIKKKKSNKSKKGRNCGSFDFLPPLPLIATKKKRMNEIKVKKWSAVALMIREDVNQMLALVASGLTSCCELLVFSLLLFSRGCRLVSYIY